MPLTLRIESELDERSATAAANRAERVYADASRNISKSMTSQIGEGARETGKAVEKMADSARASYQKVLKAQDELAQQERQLKQMREDGARGVEVQAERVRQARRVRKGCDSRGRRRAE
jgi:alkylated DNA nucleotide flippase Atl1